MSKYKCIISILILTLIAGSLIMCGNSEAFINYDDKVTEYNMDYGKPSRIYDSDYQTSLLSQIIENKKNHNYTLENPLIIKDPFNTNTLSLYIYFKSSKLSYAEYTVHTDNPEISDFTRILNNKGNKNLTKVHEYSLIGLIPDEINTIKIKLYNKNNHMFASKTFKYGPISVSENADIVLEKESAKSSENLSEGLFVTLGYINGKDNNTYYYDNNGYMRGELKLDKYRIDRMLFKDNYMYISVDTNKIAKINNLGYAEKIYDLGKYEMHHDYIFSDDKNSIIILASDSKSDGSEDRVISLNLDTSEVKEIIDFNKVFPEVRKIAVVPKEKVKYDWIHINSLELLHDDSMLFSARELSSIIKMKNINTNPEIDYIIADKSIWKDTPYESYVLEKEGDFQIQSGQHCLQLNNDSGNEYYLSMYNNNTKVSSSYPEFDWSEVQNTGKVSMYYKYIINEKNRTFSLAEEIIVEPSRYISSIENYKNHIIIESGQSKVFYEYDSAHELIAKYKIDYEMWGLYRCFKYDFKNYYFL